MPGLYRAVENAVKRPVKILFFDNDEVISRNRYRSKAYFKTNSNKQIPKVKSQLAAFEVPQSKLISHCVFSASNKAYTDIY